MSVPSNPEAVVDLARQDLASGQIAAAQEKCLRVLDAHHHHPGALDVLGTILCSQGRYEEAVRVFNALTLMQPTVAAHWQNLGTVLRPTGRRAQALSAFERALRLHRKFNCFFNLASFSSSVSNRVAARSVA